jgi:hypothetical protein
MEPEGSLSYSQEPDVSPYLQPDKAQQPHPISPIYILILYSHPCLGLPNDSRPHVFQPNCFMYSSPMRVTCPTYLTFLDLIIKIIFGQDQRS